MEERVRTFMRKLVPGGVAELVYSTDITPKQSLINKLHYFYHPYNADFNCRRYMTFDNEDY